MDEEDDLNEAYEHMRRAMIELLNKYDTSTAIAASVLATAVFSMVAWGGPSKASNLLTKAFSEDSLVDLSERLLADAIAHRKH